MFIYNSIQVLLLRILILRGYFVFNVLQSFFLPYWLYIYMSLLDQTMVAV